MLLQQLLHQHPAYRYSGGFILRWIGSIVGLVLTVGSMTGILSFALGLIIQTPANAHFVAVQMAEIAVQQKMMSDGV
jgi:hypothetical protein